MVTSTATALLRYLVTGGTAAVVDIEGFTLLSSTRIPVAVAAACSFGAATIVNFLLTSRWVFRATPTWHRYAVFVIAATLALLVNVAVTYAGVTYLDLSPRLAKVFAVGTTFLLSFWINTHVVFRTPG